MAAKMLQTQFYKNTLKLISTRFTSNYTNNEIPESVLQARQNDTPVDIPNPFEKPKVQCILCKYGIEPDYKNVRLLSQFVSRFTGRIYGRHITALCEKKQFKVEQEIQRSRSAGFMPFYLKDPIYFDDPKLYDPENPIKPHKY